MPDITVPLVVATGAWGVISTVVAALWTRGNSAKDQTIAVLQSENERLVTERDELGKRLDDLRDLLERERLQAAGVVERIRNDAKVPNEFAEDMPTAVRDRADLIASRKSLPPGMETELKKYSSDMSPTPPDPIMARKRL